MTDDELRKLASVNQRYIPNVTIHDFDEFKPEMARYLAAAANAVPSLLERLAVGREAIKQALRILTANDPESQSHPESPYHFLWAMLDADNQARDA
jgi:hypothetical protein